MLRVWSLGLSTVLLQVNRSQLTAACNSAPLKWRERLPVFSPAHFVRMLRSACPLCLCAFVLIMRINCHACAAASSCNWREIST